MNKCIDCGKKIYQYKNVKRCFICAKKGRNNPRYGKGKFDKILTLNFLIKNYIKKSKSTIILAKEIGCSDGTVRNALIKNNIKRKRNSKIEVICNNCNKIFKIYISNFNRSELHFCSRKCTYIWHKGKNCFFYHTNLSKGKRNSHYIDGRKSKKYYCKECNEQISYGNWRHGTKRCRSCAIKGKNHPNYIDGRSFEKYPAEFNDTLRESIRKRDNYTCQNCGMTEEEHFIVYGRNLHIHHIDYNKDNCKEDNLITLCQGCNLRANYNREYWKEFYNKKIKEIQNGSYISISHNS